LISCWPKILVGFINNTMHVTTKSDLIQENGIIPSLHENEVKDDDNQMDNSKLMLNLKGKRGLLIAVDALRVPLRLSCIQCLILQTLLGRKAPQSPLWCSLLNRKLISNVTVVIVDGWDLCDLTSIMSYGNKSPNNKDLQGFTSVILNGDEPPKKKRKRNSVIEDPSHSVENLSTLERIERSLPNASTCFPLKFEVDSPSQNSDDPIEELFTSIPMSVNVVETIKEKYKCLRDAVKFHVVSRVDSTVYSKSKCTLDEPKFEEEPEKNFTSVEEDLHNELSKVDLLLSVEEMGKFKYPLGVEGTISGRDSEYVPLHSYYDEVTPNSPMFGIDCEMCQTIAGHELTRISVVIYTSFVKPDNPIIDYLTRYSGVTSSDLENVTTSLVDVQQKLRELLPKDCILVGHSLENDLTALKLLHPYVIDTSLIYNLSHDVYHKPSLKLLTKLFLNKDIQNRGKNGHHPSEDAVASLELVLLKLKNGSYFGDVNKGGQLPCSPSEYLKTLKANRVKKYNNFDLSYIENYESTVPKIIRLEEGNNSLFVTNNSNTKTMFESYGADWCHLVHQYKDSFKVEPEAHTTFRLVVRHCQD
ncbi:putative RNA exonuclease NEF-sp, partial [Armadillidium nasatum]